ncbi:MAG: hypothetical protein PVI78_11145 [Anaerolineales bacterium]|jgi:hypothetical protein
MLKKIGLWVLIAGFSGLLIWGAVNRTAARDDGSQNNEAAVQNRGRSSESKDVEVSGRQGETSGQRGQSANASSSRGNGRDASVTSSLGQGRGNAGQQGESATSPVPEADHQDDWDQLLGEVLNVDETSLELVLADSETFIIEGQTWRYAQELGLTVEIGDEVSVSGYLEDDEFKVGSLENLTSGQIVILREASGRPVWAGGGQGRARG